MFANKSATWLVICDSFYEECVTGRQTDRQIVMKKERQADIGRQKEREGGRRR